MKRINGIDSNMIANNLTSFYQTHPGEVLKDEVEARGMSQKTLADNMGMSYKALNDILNERRPVSVDSAMMFEAALGIPAQTLLGLQIEYDIAKNKKDKSFLQRIASIKRVAAVLVTTQLTTWGLPTSETINNKYHPSATDSQKSIIFASASK